MKTKIAIVTTEIANSIKKLLLAGNKYFLIKEIVIARNTNTEKK